MHEPRHDLGVEQRSQRLKRDEQRSQRHDHESETAKTENPLAIRVPLKKYFDALETGPGLWKWDHYWNIYEKHLARFRGTDLTVAEVGVFSGGSLKMWRWYFGNRAKIYGIDISNRTMVYEQNADYGSPQRIFVGDQNDPNLWDRFAKEVPSVDVFLDDGSHVGEHQIATLEAMWPRIAPGGVFLVEDIEMASRRKHAFMEYVWGRFLYGPTGMSSFHLQHRPQEQQRLHMPPTSMEQLTTAVVSFYHQVVVLEKQPETQPPYTQRIRLLRRGT